MAKKRYFVQRSTDGQIIYVRKEPHSRWEARIDPINGSSYVFEELGPGESGWYEFQRLAARPRVGGRAVV